MRHDRERWNQKYSQGASFGPPCSLIASFFHLAPGKRVLDIAAGDGRNALFLAQKGFHVLAVDISDEAMSLLRQKRSLALFPVQADMDTFPIRPMTYDLIINCRFLDRRLFPYIQEGLTKNGILIFESALESHQPGISQPQNRDHLLRANNELLHSFLSLHILLYRESIQIDSQNQSHVSFASLIAQKTNF
jgi:SAM-dependent methyltransferase